MFADVEGSNIVGYSSSQLNSGKKRICITPMFSSVGKEAREIRFGDITPMISTGKAGGGQVTVYTLTSGGRTDQTYMWTGSYWMHNSKNATEETLPEGKGLWVFCNYAEDVTAMLQSAGEVNTTEDIVVTLNGDKKRIALGNGFPAGVTFADIVPEAVNGGTVAGGQVMIYTLASGGRTDQTYIWTGAYWMHNNKNASTEEVPAGQGLWVYCGIAEATTKINLRIKNPLKAAN